MEKRAIINTITSGSENGPAYFADRKLNGHEVRRHKPDHNSYLAALSARALKRTLLAVLLTGLAVFAPLSPYAQTTAPTLSYAGVLASLGTGLLGPGGVAVDGKGNVFIADTSNNRVVEVPSNGGAQTTVISTGLSIPTGVAVDAGGNLYIADTGNSRVLKVSPNGIQTTVGTGLNSPHGLAVDSAADVFIADTGNGRVVVYSPSGNLLAEVSDLTYPFDVAVDAAGDMFIATQQGALEVKPIPPMITLGTVTGATGIAVDSTGDVFIADSGNNVLVEIPAGGSQTTVLGSLSGPEQLAVDSRGDVFVADSHNNRIFEFGTTNFGNVNVCPAGKTSPAPCSQTLTLTYNVTAGGTVGSVKVLTQGAANLDFTLASTTCTGTLTAGKSCTVTVKFAPLVPGLRMGAVQILSSGTAPTVLASTPIFGNGQGPLVAFSPSTPTTVGSELNNPSSVAVDAKGNVFIANSGSGEFMEVPAGGGSQVLLATALSDPQGIAVDGAGDIFVADSDNNRVLQIPAGGGTTVVLGSGLAFPTGVAVDGAGNLFISDTHNQRVVEIPYGGGSQTTVASGFIANWGLAVDGAGNVFVADSGNNQIQEIPAGGGAQITVASGLDGPLGLAVDAAGDLFITGLSGSVIELPLGKGPQITLLSGLTGPSGLAVDPKGDVFEADFNNNRVIELHRSQAPALTFTSGVGRMSYSQQLTVSNIGNQSLNAVSPGITIGTDFVQLAVPSSPTDCTAKFSLAAGTGCNISLTFTPPAVGRVSSKLVLTDNSLHAAAATQTVTLNGTGETVLTPTVHVTGGPFTYTGLPQAATCTATGTGGVIVPGSCLLAYNGSLPAPTNAGTYNVTATFSSMSPYYGNATGTGKFTIDRAPLTITANNIVYLQGTTFPKLTASYSGFVNYETPSVVKGLNIITTATASSAVGNYPIVVRGATAANYTITFVPGTFTVQPPTGISGTYILTNLNSGMVLGVQGASTAEGADIVQWPSNGSPDQQWTLSLAANGAYLITDVNSGFVIGVNGASTSEGAKLIQWQSNGSEDQQWVFTPVGSAYRITDVNSGMEMDIEGASKIEGTQAFQWPSDGSSSQLWILTLVPPAP